MKKLVKLTLNEDGKKALYPCKEKTIYVEDNGAEINKEEINKLFPITLVDSYEVITDFSLLVGHYAKIVDGDGVVKLGKIFAAFTRDKVQASLVENGHISFTFHANGIEATHSKKKAHLEEITDEEVERYLYKIKIQPFLEILEKLSDDGRTGISFDPDSVKIPEWLDEEHMCEIIDQLNSSEAKYNFVKNNLG